MRFLESDIQKETIVNIDESRIGLTYYRKMNWAYSGHTNNQTLKKLDPRISMMTFVDTQKEVFLSLFQSNTKSNTFKLFIKELS